MGGNHRTLGDKVKWKMRIMERKVTEKKFRYKYHVPSVGLVYTDIYKNDILYWLPRQKCYTIFHCEL